jgi:hypothetical protein
METYPFLLPGEDKPSPLPYAPFATGRFALVAVVYKKKYRHQLSGKYGKIVTK